MTRTIMVGAGLAALSVCAAPPAGARVVEVTAHATCGVEVDQTEGVRRALAVAVRGCAVRVAGADDYARCVDGPHAGRPCESWCDAGPLRNVTCGSDEYCAPGVCLHAEDCPGMSCLAGPHAGRACDGARDCPAGQCTKGGCVGGARDGQRCDCPGSVCGANCRGESGAPSGPGGIDVVDLGRASHAVIDGVRLFDHRRGALSFAVGDDGLLRDADNTRTMRAEFDPLFTAGPRVAV